MELKEGKWINPFLYAPWQIIAHGLNRGLWKCMEFNKPFQRFIKLELRKLNMPHSFNKIWIHTIWSTKTNHSLWFKPWALKIHGIEQNRFNGLINYN